MLAGDNVALHKNTVCYLTLPGVSDLDGASCSVAGFDRNKQLWQVKLHDASARRNLLVPTASLRVGYCMLPASIDRLKKFVAILDDPMVGKCGRGLVVGEPVSKGDPVFMEPPILVAGACDTDYNDHHVQRWKAYASLMAGAAQEAASGKEKGPCSRALTAFNDLDMQSHPPEHASAGAEHIAEQLLQSSPTPVLEAERVKHIQSVRDVLIRFSTNQFLMPYEGREGMYAPGAATRLTDAYRPQKGDGPLTRSALYVFTSRCNHSCEPTLRRVPQCVFAQMTGVQCDVEQGGGVLLLYALRQLEPGDELTFNYGPDELLGWEVGKRREYLDSKLGFVCMCTRCVAEAPADASDLAAAAQTTQAAAHVEVGTTEQEPEVAAADVAQPSPTAVGGSDTGQTWMAPSRSSGWVKCGVALAVLVLPAAFVVLRRRGR